MLAVSVVKDLSLLTADGSVAFMHAPVEAEACDLVLLPANILINGCQVIVWLGKAMNGVRRAPQLWFLELQRVVYSMGGQDTFENTPMDCFWCLFTSTCLSLQKKPNRGRNFLAEIAEYLENKTYWKDSSAQEGRRTVFEEKHLENPP